MRIKKAISLALAFMLMVTCVAVGLSAPATAATRELKFRADGTFKILQIADMQKGNTLDTDVKQMIQAMLRKHQPDLVALTGDNVAGLLGGGGSGVNATTAIGQFMNIFQLYDVPVAAVFGNHDYEVDGMFAGSQAKSKQIPVYQTYANCLMVDKDSTYTGTINNSVGNYNLLIKSSKDANKVAYNLWFFDSGESNSTTYDGVKADVVNWYKWKSNQLKQQNGGQLVPSVVFQHIVVTEITDALAQYGGWGGYPNTTYNFFGEKPCPPSSSKNYGEFSALVAQGDVKAMFFGHDHKNNFNLTWQGIQLVGTAGIGTGGYTPPNRGCRIITLHEDNPNQIDLTTEFINSQGTMPAVETAHSFGGWQVRTPASCTAANLEFRKCANDYFEETRSTTAALGHNWGNWQVVTPATEDAEGVERRVCGRDPSHFETRAIPKLPHTHNFVPVVTAPTCTTEGYTTYTCAKEGASYVTDYTLALGHEWGNWIVTTQPTEDAEGVETSTCGRNPLHTQTRSIAKLPHTHVWGNWNVTTPATEETEGVETRICDKDASHVETRALAKLPHTHVYSIVVTTPPTCTVRGYTTHTCVKGDTSYVDTYVDALGHSWDEWVTVTPATEETEGVQTCVCKRNANHTDVRSIPKLTHVHSYTSSVTLPTCTAQGYTTHTCTKGDHTYTDNPVNALGHDWGAWSLTTPATAEHDGIETCVCNRNASHAKTRYHEHDFIGVATPPTCTQWGFTTYTCAADNITMVADYLDSLGHDWGGWQVTTPATTAAEGVETNICNRNHEHVETRPIPKLPATQSDVTLENVDASVIVDENLHYIYGIPAGVTATTMLGENSPYLRATNGGIIVPVTTNALIGTGFQIRLVDNKLPIGHPQKERSYYFVVFGDGNGDGKVDLEDVRRCESMFGTAPTTMSPAIFALSFLSSSYLAEPTVATRNAIQSAWSNGGSLPYASYAAQRASVVAAWFKLHPDQLE